MDYSCYYDYDYFYYFGSDSGLKTLLRRELTYYRFFGKFEDFWNGFGIVGFESACGIGAELWKGFFLCSAYDLRNGLTPFSGSVNGVRGGIKKLFLF